MLDLEPPVATEDGRLYRASVVGRAAGDGHWNAWLEFVEPRTEDVLSTDVETHQSTEGNLHAWATTLSDVYLRGALNRARISRPETAAHRRAADLAAHQGRGVAKALDPFELFALGEHVLRRELQPFRRSALLSLIITHDLNPRGLDLSTLSQAQLVAFIVTAIEVRCSRHTG